MSDHGSKYSGFNRARLLAEIAGTTRQMPPEPAGAPAIDTSPEAIHTLTRAAALCLTEGLIERFWMSKPGMLGMTLAARTEGRNLTKPRIAKGRKESRSRPKGTKPSAH